MSINNISENSAAEAPANASIKPFEIKEDNYTLHRRFDRMGRLVGDDMMKKLLFPIMILAILVAFYIPKIGKLNVIFTTIAVVIFMFGMMKLSAKTPSKNQDDDDATI